MTTVSNETPVNNLLIRLRALDKKLAGKSLTDTFFPDWWSEEAEQSPSAIQQLKVIIARHLNLELGSVLNDSDELRFKDTHCKYKRTTDKGEHELQVATSIAASLAQSVVEVTLNDYSPFGSAEEIRKSILDSGRPYVDLESLIEYSWNHGVPVLHVPQIPASKKMDGLAIDIDGRPVIFLSKDQKHSAYILFDLAHEIGHIALGHVRRGEVLVDEVITRDKGDEQEDSANHFALELLNGNADVTYLPTRNRIKAVNLAVEARKLSKQNSVDPGHIVLHWGYNKGHWPTANGALNRLNLDSDWRSLFSSALTAGIEEEDLPDEDLDYLLTLTGIDSKL